MCKNILASVSIFFSVTSLLCCGIAFYYGRKVSKINDQLLTDIYKLTEEKYDKQINKNS